MPKFVISYKHLSSLKDLQSTVNTIQYVILEYNILQCIGHLYSMHSNCTWPDSHCVLQRNFSFISAILFSLNFFLLCPLCPFFTQLDKFIRAVTRNFLPLFFPPQKVSPRPPIDPNIVKFCFKFSLPDAFYRTWRRLIGYCEKKYLDKLRGGYSEPKAQSSQNT